MFVSNFVYSDTTFGPPTNPQGIVTTSVGGLTSGINSMAFDEQGRIVVGGSTDNATQSTYSFALARYLDSE